jgi:hypothetical protein
MKMKEQGIREDDPEFRKLHAILSTLSHVQKTNKEQLARRQAQAQVQAQAQHGSNGAPNLNGINGI